MHGAMFGPHGGMPVASDTLLAGPVGMARETGRTAYLLERHTPTLTVILDAEPFAP
jgi:hypothetical protein